MWENVVQPDRPQMTIWRTRIACLRLQTHTQNMSYLLRFHCNNGSTKLPHVTLYVHCHSPSPIVIVRTTKQQILKGKAVFFYFHMCSPQRQATCYNARHSQKMRDPFYIYVEYGNWQFWSSTCTQGSAARWLEFTLAGQAVPSQAWQNPSSCTCG